MKTVILTLSTLAFLSTTTFAETKPNVPAKEASQIFKAAGFSKTKHGWGLPRYSAIYSRASYSVPVYSMSSMTLKTFINSLNMA